MAIKIELTKSNFTIVDDVDADLNQFKWRANGIETHRYAVRLDPLTKQTISMHRVILSRALGRSLEKCEFVDHIDGNTLNNIRSNLRVATHAENLRNRKRQSNNKSGFKGVTYSRGRWVAEIRANKRKIYLGSYNTPEEAHEAYKTAAVKYHGDFANFGD